VSLIAVVCKNRGAQEFDIAASAEET
jgi:hypothetical protein